MPYESFEAKDGFVNIAVTNQKQWENFCQVLGLPELAHDERFESMKARLANYGELRPRIERLSRNDPGRSHPAMAEVGIPAGPINTVAEILEDPHIHAREMVAELPHPEYGPLKVLGIPVKLSETPGAVGKRPRSSVSTTRSVLKMDRVQR